MDITKKLITNQRNFSLGRRGHSITGIVLHTEAAPYIPGKDDRSLFYWFNTNNRGVSAHFYVTFSGKIEQYVLNEDTAHQAGNWEINLRTIGIEHQDNGHYEYTDEQYEASSRLVAQLCQLYEIPVEHVSDISTANGITVHKEVPRAQTGCPHSLDWNRIIDGAKEIIKMNEHCHTGIFVATTDTALLENPDHTAAEITAIPNGNRVGVYEGFERAIPKLGQSGEWIQVQYLEPGKTVTKGWIDATVINPIPPGFFFANSVVNFSLLTWFRYYGNNRYALQATEYGYSQHLHGGLDFGNGTEMDVRAGVHGEITRLTKQFYQPHGVYIRIQEQPYTVVYGHLSELAEALKPYLEYEEDLTLPNPIPVTPDTVLGKVKPGTGNHLHLEVRFAKVYDYMILNTLLFFDEVQRQDLFGRFPHQTNWKLNNSSMDEFVHEHNGRPWELWHTPLDQPTLYCGNYEKIGPTTL